MSTITGDKPVLLLDEVVAELDEQRREALLQTVNAADQALLTATDPAMFTNEFIKTATTLKVENGRVTNR
jgi:DNA replication and repair protein RecF